MKRFLKVVDNHLIGYEWFEVVAMGKHYFIDGEKEDTEIAAFLGNANLFYTHGTELPAALLLTEDGLSFIKARDLEMTAQDYWPESTRQRLFRLVREFVE